MTSTPYCFLKNNQEFVFEVRVEISKGVFGIRHAGKIRPEDLLEGIDEG